VCVCVFFGLLNSTVAHETYISDMKAILVWYDTDWLVLNLVIAESKCSHIEVKKICMKGVAFKSESSFQVLYFYGSI